MGDRLQKLKELEAFLYVQMHNADVRTVAAIARQYRETVKEIEEIEGPNSQKDEVGKLIAECEDDGVTRAVHKNRSKVKNK